MKTLWLWIALLAAAAASGTQGGEPDRPADAPAPRLVVFGDVHGAYDALASLLEATGIVDRSGHWTGGRTRLVSVGDLIDRGPGSRAVLDLLMRLEDEARAAGGAVHVVLGNHELMAMLADFRYVSAEDFASFADLEPPGLRERMLDEFAAAGSGTRADFLERYPPGYFGRRAAFAPTGRYGRWLLSLPVLLEIGDTAFVHGGLPPVVARSGDALNDKLRREIRGFIDSWYQLTLDGVIAWDADPLEAADDIAGRLGDGADRPLGPEFLATAKDFVAFSGSAAMDELGPLWYRGTAYCHPLLEDAVLHAGLAKLGVTRVVVGHSPTADRRIVSRLGGDAILVDTGMNAAWYHGRSAALVVEPDRLSAFYPEEPERATLTTEQSVALAPFGDADRIERTLAEAGVTGDVSDPDDRRYRLLELSAGESRLDARFTSARGFKKEIAAWRLDRALGLGLVPPAVRRTVQGKDGAILMWAEGLRSEADREKSELERPNWCASGNDYQLMYIFDALLYNTRTTGTIRYTRAQKQLVLADHLQAFGTQSRIPEYLRDADVVMPSVLAERLAALDDGQLEALLGDLLSKRETAAVLKRRDRILELWPPRATIAPGVERAAKAR